VLDQLAELRSLTRHALFGGYGLSHQKKFFGIVHKSRPYFNVTPAMAVSIRNMAWSLSCHP
jgi:TfoX/Sxy family transcriptional regulator of competence genes